MRTKRKSARPGPVVYVPIDDYEEQSQQNVQQRTVPQKKASSQSTTSREPVQQETEVPKKKGKHKGLRIFGLIILMVLVLGGCAYGAVSYYFADRFFEGTWINGVDCSQMTAYEVEDAFKQKFQSYSIEVSSRNLAAQSISGQDISYQYLSTGEVLALLKQQKPYEWIRGLYEQKSYTVSENTGYNKTQLQEQLKALECAKAENQTEPENAYVAYQDGQFVIVPETEGSKLDIKAAYQVLNEAVSEGKTSIDFNDTPEAYVSADVRSDSPELQSALEACNNYTKASITYTFGTQTTTLNGDTIKDWLQFDEKGQLIWDDNSFQQHVADYVAQLAATYDTVGTEREFQATSGRTVYVSSSVYGWKIDQAAEAAQLSQEIQSGTQTSREPIYAQTANSYGVNDLGDTYIEVDLSEQHMYYYQNGADIFESDFVSGNMSYADRQTHSGIFTLYYKKSPDVLRGAQKADGTYEYEQKVEYWMPFDGGIGFHDATWRDEFGGDIYLTNGSHGCINLPPENAAVLYDLIQYGVPIVCFY
ncbi:L,D-transpeptidase/peptidoglycan binding protein [Blautia sp. MSJ-19]|nr:L,D-transpeptidase/peptidoglycan binding protein [Blautia sp. MSJ-19]